MPYHGHPEHTTSWLHQDLNHPLGRSTAQNDFHEAQQMSVDPIRRPILAQQKYLSQLSNSNPQKYCQSATMKSYEQDMLLHPASPSQDCSMSSYSSSGYDSMTQPPPSLSPDQIPLNYSTNYDNVRGHLRGPFVSYTNKRK